MASKFCPLKPAILSFWRINLRLWQGSLAWMRIWTDNVKCLLTDLTAVIQASFLLPSLSTLLHHSALLFTFLSYSILSAEWEAPTWPRNTPQCSPSPLAPVRAALLGHNRQRGGPLWRSGPGVWLERRNVWSVNEHTQSVKTHLHIHTANWSTPTVCWTRQADEEEEWHSFSCLSSFPSHPSSPPQLIHSVHLRGGWRDGLSLIGHKWEGFVYPGGGGVKRVR